VETLLHTIDFVEDWLDETEMEPELQECLLEYARGRGGLTMEEICCGRAEDFRQLGKEQDDIGWRCFMEGMISKQARQIQALYHYSAGTKASPEKWAMGLVQKLLEATHGQWLYQNVQIHDKVVGTMATLRKEAIQKEIEEQMEQGGDSLLEEEQWLMEVNLGDMEESSSEREQYWLVGIQTAWEAAMLTRQRNEAWGDKHMQDGH
jgi:hypothetical protein